MKGWALLLRNVAAVEALLFGSSVVIDAGAPAGRWLFVWAAVAGGLAVAQRDDAYVRGVARRG